MQTEAIPVKIIDCKRRKGTSVKGNPIVCKGMVPMYHSVGENFIQGTCDTCGFINGEKID